MAGLEALENACDTLYPNQLPLRTGFLVSASSQPLVPDCDEPPRTVRASHAVRRRIALGGPDRIDGLTQLARPCLAGPTVSPAETDRESILFQWSHSAGKGEWELAAAPAHLLPHAKLPFSMRYRLVKRHFHAKTASGRLRLITPGTVLTYWSSELSDLRVTFEVHSSTTLELFESDLDTIAQCSIPLHGIQRERVH